VHNDRKTGDLFPQLKELLDHEVVHGGVSAVSVAIAAMASIERGNMSPSEAEKTKGEYALELLRTASDAKGRTWRPYPRVYPSVKFALLPFVVNAWLCAETDEDAALFASAIIKYSDKSKEFATLFEEGLDRCYYPARLAAFLRLYDEHKEKGHPQPFDRQVFKIAAHAFVQRFPAEFVAALQPR